MKFRWGIVGVGNIASDFITALEHVPEAEVLCVGSRNIQKAEAFVKKFPNRTIKPYGSFEEIISDPNVDILYIAVPPVAHKEISILALQKGKNLLIEKPFAMNEKEATEIVQVAREKNLFVMDGLWTRFFPATQKVRDLIVSGVIGDVIIVQADIGYNAPEEYIQKIPGTLLDIGVYPINIASMVYGGCSPTFISAQVEKFPSGIDSTTILTLNFKPGQKASLYFTFKANTPIEANIIGTKGRIRMHYPFTSCTKISVKVDQQNEFYKEFPLPVSKGSYNYPNSVGLHYEAQHVQECIAQGLKNSPILSLEETLKIMKVMDDVTKQ